MPFDTIALLVMYRPFVVAVWFSLIKFEVDHYYMPFDIITLLTCVQAFCWRHQRPLHVRTN